MPALRRSAESAPGWLEPARVETMKSAQSKNKLSDFRIIEHRFNFKKLLPRSGKSGGNLTGYYWEKHWIEPKEIIIFYRFTRLLLAVPLALFAVLQITGNRGLSLYCRSRESFAVSVPAPIFNLFQFWNFSNSTGTVVFLGLKAYSHSLCPFSS